MPMMENCELRNENFRKIRSQLVFKCQNSSNKSSSMINIKDKKIDDHEYVFFVIYYLFIYLFGVEFEFKYCFIINIFY